MIKHIVFSLFAIISLLNCKNELVSASDIIDKSIEISGGNLIEASTIDFDFRDKHYTAIRNNGTFELKRSFEKDSLKITDNLNNNGFTRSINNNIVKVPDSMVPRYSASVNSVHYFSVLPYGLNAVAVNKKYLGQAKIKEQAYYKVEVTFNKEGGGEDFEDVFIYYVNTENFKVDYFSYSYEEDHGRGLRFREAYNERYVNGVRFVDYNNYKPKSTEDTLDNLEVIFENNGLELLSKIELKSIEVDLSQF